MIDINHPKAIEMMNMIEEVIRKLGGASSDQIGKALKRKPATICNYLRAMWKAGRIRYLVRKTARTPAVWEIGRDPHPVDGKDDITAVYRPVLKQWEPHHKRGVLECLWFGVPAAMVIQ